MVERLAVKVLSPSDLTFFEAHFGKTNRSNQKAINLNTDVFTGELYPSMASDDAGIGQEVPVTVSVFGPEPEMPEYRFPRSIAKGARYKNWRLNGAAVPDPDGEQGRFDTLRADDVAVIEFNGDPRPESVRVVIVAADIDPILTEALRAATPGGRRSMARVSREMLASTASELNLPNGHHIRILLGDDEIEALLEEAQSGSEPAVRRLKERVARPISQTDFAASRRNAERIGALGEALAAEFLDGEVAAGRLVSSNWIAEKDAASSWDFDAVERRGGQVRYDAKATSGTHSRPFFMSGAEAMAAAGEPPYRVVRVSEVTNDGGIIKVSEPINGLMRIAVAASEALPDGVLPTGFSILPSMLAWEDRGYIERPDEPGQ